MRRIVVPLAALVIAAATAISAAAEPIPDYRGIDVGQAAGLARDGFTVIRSWYVSPEPQTLVVEQWPFPGTDRSTGSGVEINTVNFWVSTGLEATGRPAAEFRTTRGAIYCQVNTASEITISLVCWRPRDGVMVWFAASEPWVNRHRVPGARGKRSTGFRTIGYGGTWRRHGIRCVSRPAGLTCRNHYNDGVFIGTVRGARKL